MNAPKLHAELCKQREKLKGDIFEEPPFDMRDFSIRLGRYQQLKADIELLESSMRGIENDDVQG